MAAAPNSNPGVTDPPAPTDPPKNQDGISPPEPPAQADDPNNDPPPQPSGEELKFTREALDKRLERERVKAQSDFLKSMGFDSVDAYNDWKKQHDAEQEEKAKLEREKMSEIERYKADAAELQKKIDEAEMARNAAVEEAEAARVEAHLHSVFAAKGIKNTEYAMFRIETKLNELGDDEELDENAFLDELLKDPSDSIALGVAAPEQKNKSAPATTTHGKKGPDPKQPANSSPNKHASDMTNDEWQAFKKQHGLS